MDWFQQSWRAALEIAILTVGIYSVIRFVRGTRGAPVVTGFLLLLLALTLVTIVLDLRVLRLILSNFFTFFAIAVIVIFQPELRRMLAELGNLPLFGGAHEQRENLEVIVRTVERLADVRIGMLVAIEQTVQLQDVVLVYCLDAENHGEREAGKGSSCNLKTPPKERPLLDAIDQAVERHDLNAKNALSRS